MANTIALTSAARPGASPALWKLSPSAVLRAYLRLSPAMWLVQLYVFFEYVRPQSIYEWLDIAPWSLMCLIAATVLCAIEGRFRFSSKSLWGAVLAFTSVILLSSITAQYPSISWGNLDIWVNWLLLMLIVGAGIRTREELLLLLLSFVLWNVKMTQHGVRGFIGAGFGFRASGVGGAPGWFQNSGEFGIEMCVFLPIITYLAYALWPRLSRTWKLAMVGIAGSILVSIVASSSRGALLGAAAVGLWILWRVPNRLRSLAALVALAAVTWAIVPAESKQRFSEAGEDQTSVTRITYWKDGITIASDHPVLGIGYKNWLQYYRAYYNPKGQYPHNYFIEALAELGYVGFLSLLALIFLVFRETARIRRQTSASSPQADRFLFATAFGIEGAMIGFLVSGFFVTVLYYPFVWMNLALAMALSRVTNDRAFTRSTGKVLR